ncbi:hypothetical protein AB9K41_20650, partial [Cribrihabitans sp. XS_ASV171]
VQYTGPTDASGQDQAVLTISANDGTVNPQLGTVNIDITAVNDAPAATGIPTDITVTEDTSSNIDLSAVTFADADGDALTVTLSVDTGTFSTPADGSGLGVTETLVNATTITLVGSAADINTYLDTASNVQYTGPTDASGQDQAVLTISANDGTVNPQLGTVNIDITAVNDAPAATGIPTDITVIEDTASNIDLSGVTFADLDGDTLTVTLLASSGTLNATAAGGVAVAGDGSASLSLTGTAGAINTFLDTASAVTYTGANNLFGEDAATLSINVDDATVNPLLGTVNLDITDVIDTQTGDNGDNTLFGDDGQDILIGLLGDDGLFGQGGADSLTGGGDDDTLNGGAGADTLQGGDGRDVLSYIGSPNGVFVDLNDAGGGFQTAAGGDATGDVVSGFERIFGSGFGDDLNGDDGDNLIYGRGGSDSIDGGGGNDTIGGGGGADIDGLSGGDGIDVLSYTGSFAG